MSRATRLAVGTALIFAGAFALIAIFATSREHNGERNEELDTEPKLHIQREHGSGDASSARSSTLTAESPGNDVHRSGSSDPWSQRGRVLDTAIVPRAAISNGAVYAQGRWGSNAGEFGVSRDEEANPEAPMAIFAAEGEVFVLDQVNSRIQIFRDGKAVASIPTNDTAQDLARLPSGETVVLDRLTDKTAKIYASDGALQNEVTLAGKGLPDPSLATGVFADEDGIWVEREHSSSVRIADPSGQTDEARSERPGRLTKDGSQIVSIVISRRSQGELTVTTFERETLAVRWSRTFALRAPVLHILALESDLRGHLYVAAEIAREETAPPYALMDQALVILQIDGRDGTLLGNIETRPLTNGDEMLRPISVDDTGHIFLMRPGESGLEIQKFGFP